VLERGCLSGRVGGECGVELNAPLRQGAVLSCPPKLRPGCALLIGIIQGCSGLVCRLACALGAALLYLKMDPVAEEERASTPLFRHADGAAFTRSDVSSVVKELMASIGRFGAHSLRIGGATAALAAGVQPTLIRVAGRWSSDIYQIYCAASC
jgi:hypothetical protein